MASDLCIFSIRSIILVLHNDRHVGFDGSPTGKPLRLLNARSLCSDVSPFHISTPSRFVRTGSPACWIVNEADTLP
jgi:hypothetical protein